MADKFQNKYRIPSARAVWHDYNGGDYFITICTGGREHYFGEIVNDLMMLNVLGQKLNELIMNIPTHNVYAEIPVYQVMPNHVHLIVCIDKTKMIHDNCGADGADAAGSDGTDADGTDAAGSGAAGADAAGSDGTDADGTDADGTDADGTDADGTDADGTDADGSDAAGRDAACHVSTDKTDKTNETNEKMQEIADKCGLLSTAMGGIKSALTKYANTNKIEFKWQTRFHDHIIRDREEWQRIANYIVNNPTTWENDKFYTN